jgi:hypothetical protein
MCTKVAIVAETQTVAETEEDTEMVAEIQTVVVTEMCTKVAIVAETQTVVEIEEDTEMVAVIQTVVGIEEVTEMVAETQTVVAIEGEVVIIDPILIMMIGHLSRTTMFLQKRKRISH